MLSCFWGVFTLSTFVVILNNLLAHSQGEQNAYELLVKMKLKDELKASSIKVMFAVQISLHLRQLKLTIGNHNLMQAIHWIQKSDL